LLGKLIFALGILGAAGVATMVVSFTAAWRLVKVTGYKHSLEHHPLEAPWFYSVYLVNLLVGAGIVLSRINLVKLTVSVNVMNALLLTIVLATAGFGLYSVIMGMWWHWSAYA
jgi:hypothetical protein